MTFRSPGSPGRPGGNVRALRLPRRPRFLVPVLLGIVAFIIVGIIVAGVLTDYLWFRSVHFTSVFATTYGVRWALFAVTGLFMAAAVGVNTVLAYRIRPALRLTSPEQQGL